MSMRALIGIVALATPAAAQKPACAAQAYADPWPYLDRPADPWLAVVNGKPRPVSLPKDRMGMRKPNARATCDAAHDHCLRDCTWLLTPTPTKRRATLYHFGTDGKFVTDYHDPNPQPGYVAYRTVPVTRKNLAKGMLVASVVDGNGGRPDGGGPHPDGDQLQNEFWDIGIVESIEWDRNIVRLEGVAEPYYLSGTRLVVLKYTEGKKVEKLEGVDDKVPALADLITPAKPAKVGDPWSQVGKDKQPLANTDTLKMSSLASDCTSKTDHCLRPWVWFVTVDGEPVAARYTGKQFVFAEDPSRAIAKPGLAYRTRPAKESELVAGTKVILFDSATAPGSEKDAHYWRAWTFAKVVAIDRYTHTMDLDDGRSKRSTDNARIMVVYWLPGEKADAVE